MQRLMKERFYKKSKIVVIKKSELTNTNSYQEAGVLNLNCKMLNNNNIGKRYKSYQSLSKNPKEKYVNWAKIS